MKDPTASPYHDWNDCIYDQCYKPNRAARLLNSRGEISYITNNYRHLSFNVGPTLHAWIEKRHPTLATYIADADREATASLGEGGAIAQAYNHIILPLSEERDIRTQIVWGARDFAHRFGRSPKGMWLPETAVNTPTLEALAACDIDFTILAPHQCAAIRTTEGTWSQTPGGNGLDVTKPYFMTLPSGRRITLVFYYGSIAHDIAFGGLLDNGDYFADALLSKLPRDDEPRLLTIATDGETYGHHHRYGEMALARATQRLCDSPDAVLTNVAAFLAHYPAKIECRIAENTSWSCAHGVERWRSDCGCHTGGEPGWNQRWRAPLRSALDRLRDRIDEVYENEMGRYCDSPWELRNDAIELYLMDFADETPIEDIRERKTEFLKKRCGSLAEEDTRKVLALIEAQRMRMFMYTSCGWFFNDIAGIETRQLMAYALRASEYIREISGTSFEDDFLRDLKKAPGNTPDAPTGYDVLMKYVMPLKRSVVGVAASAALMATSAGSSYYSFKVKSGGRAYPSGDMGLSVTKMNVSDVRTLESWNGASVVFSTGGLDDICRLTEKAAPSQKDTWSAFYTGDIISITQYLEKSFELGPWRFKDLPQDDRDIVAAERTKDAEREHMEYAEELLASNQRLLVQLNMIGVESSPFLHAAASFVYEQRMADLATDAKNILDLLEPESRLEVLLDEAHRIGIYPELSALVPAMEAAFREKLISAMDRNDDDSYAEALSLWERAMELRIEIGRWSIQNRMWAILGRRETTLSSVVLELASAMGFATPEK
jgi:hypothetical protein